MIHGLGWVAIVGLLFGWIGLTSYVLQRRRETRRTAASLDDVPN